MNVLLTLTQHDMSNRGICTERYSAPVALDNIDDVKILCLNLLTPNIGGDSIILLYDNYVILIYTVGVGDRK